jgi:hypothetical protein
MAAPLALGGTPRALSESPQRYYLALGDSLTYGIQPAKVDRGLPPSGFKSGFVDVFATAFGERWAPAAPGGETTGVPASPRGHSSPAGVPLACRRPGVA